MERKPFAFGEATLSVMIFLILFGVCDAQMKKAQVPRESRATVARNVGQMALALPDLTVALQGPDRGIAGQNVTVGVTVRNKGTVTAPGSVAGGSKYYFVDLVLSADASVPVTLAVQPVYAGKTKDDFVEDMLLQGGRISNTQSVPAGAQVQYSLPLYIPKKTPPGLYCLGAVVDPAKAVAESNENNNCNCLGIMIAPPGPGPVTGASGVWVMPYGVGGTPLNKIKSTGLTDYTDGSGLVMNNAPFGGYLGFRHGYENSLPNAAIKYYRWLYRRGGGPWQEFTEPVSVHYVRQLGPTVTFPVYPLGPKTVAGKSLYEFRPHTPPPDPPAATSWPTTDYFGDIYSGFLNSPLLQEGQYDIRLEVYGPTGMQVMPGAGSFNFILPLNVLPDGTTTTKPAGTAVVAGGCEFALYIDNQSCSASIDAPKIGTTAVVDACGFLLYQNKATDQVKIGFQAAHPSGFGVFGFTIIRGTATANSASGEVTAAAAGLYAGNGAGVFSHLFGVVALLGASCPTKAAFSENLHVYAKATTGWGHRIAGYDADSVRAFALAPGGVVVSSLEGDCPGCATPTKRGD